jgi:hypothetical protein
MSSTAIFFSNHVERTFRKHKYTVIDFTQQRYFLICKNCYWMATTLPTFSNIHKIQYKKCPLCVTDIDRFLICDESF